ncbi:MAG TPA: hypothetical protein VGF39_05865 [Stellaceae bacterium]|jgi:hypothetical protein
MSDTYGSAYAAQHPLSTVRAKMPRATPYVAPGAAGIPNVTTTSLSVAATGVATCTPGSWTGAPTFTYQWQRGVTPIAGATAATHALVAGDVGTMLSCVVTATNANGAASAPSNVVGPVTA